MTKKESTYPKMSPCNERPRFHSSRHTLKVSVLIYETGPTTSLTYLRGHLRLILRKDSELQIGVSMHQKI
jgi:hypothetical protein